MPRNVMVFSQPSFKVATTEAGLAAGTAYECQVTAATITVSVSMNTIAATGCSGPSDSPAGSKWGLDLAWLQDLDQPGGGLSGFAIEHGDPSVPVWWELQPDKTDATVKITGNSWCVPGQVGGTFGDGSAGAATATWPCLVKPDFVYPAV